MSLTKVTSDIMDVSNVSKALAADDVVNGIKKYIDAKAMTPGPQGPQGIPGPSGTGTTTITLSGDITGSGTSSIITTLKASGVTPGQYPKVSVNAQGLVTNGTALVAADIPNLSWAKITSGKPTTLAGYGITGGVGFGAGYTWKHGGKYAGVNYYNAGPNAILVHITTLGTAGQFGFSSLVVSSSGYPDSSQYSADTVYYDVNQDMIDATTFQTAAGHMTGVVPPGAYYRVDCWQGAYIPNNAQGLSAWKELSL